MDRPEVVLVPGIAGLIALVLFFVGARALRRKRLIENVPTSKVAGVFLGLTEVKGTAWPAGAPLQSWLAERQCVYYSFSIEEEWERWEEETYTDSEGNRKTRRVRKTGWTTVASREERPPFLLRDETGSIRVVPDGATIEAKRVFSQTVTRFDPLYYAKGPSLGIPDSTGRRSFTEHAIEVGEALYVIGTGRVREDAVEPEIAADPESEMFLISTRDEAAVRRGYLWTARLCYFFGLAFAAGAPFGYYATALGDPGAALAPAAGAMALGGAGFLALVLIQYALLLHNGLVSVRNRVLNAWSQIEIQLKRRHDLIPNLVACAKAYAGHEADVQGTIAKLRAEGLSRRGAPVVGAEAAMAAVALANGQTSALRGLFAQVERYPALKADQGFRALLEELSRTETKIALARAFYNQSVTAYNDRIATIPDVLVAKARGMQPASWLEIDEFERLPVDVGAAMRGAGASAGVGPAAG